MWILFVPTTTESVESSFEASTTFLLSQRNKPSHALRSISFTGVFAGKMGSSFQTALRPPLSFQLGGQFYFSAVELTDTCY
jgi:hypothetical protein